MTTRRVVGVVVLGLLATVPCVGFPASVFDHLPAFQKTVETYKTVGGQPLTLALYFPSNHNPKVDRRAAVLFIHGGGWGTGNPDMFAPHCRYFAARGLVGMTVQYRLTKQPGVTVFNCIADVRSCMRWIRRHAGELGVATNRIAAAGDSAGGHLAACLGLIEGLDEPGEDTSVHARADAMILYNPVIDTTLPDGWDMARFGGKAGAAVANRAREFSPINHVRAGAPPTLVIHGTADTVTPIAWSERFVKAMQDAGNSVEFTKLDGRKHAFVIPFCSDEVSVRAAVEKTWTFLDDLGWTQAQPNK